MRTLLLAWMLNVMAQTWAQAALPSPPAAPPQDLDSLRDKMDASKPGVDRETLPGAAVYREHCRMCHEGQAPKAPSRTFLQMMTPEAIDRALSVGIMQRQAAALSADDKKHVAEYLSGLPFGAPEPPKAPACTGAAARFDLAREPDIVGWGFDLQNTHFIDASAAKLPAADIPKLQVKWTFGYPASARARSRPTFAYGALYVGSQTGVVYALDAKSGCIRWTFTTSAEVRTPIVVPATAGRTKRAYFGDILGRIYAVDALTGKELWRDRADDHPSATITGSPVYYKGTVYAGVSSLEEATVDPTYACCTFRGSVVAFDAVTGKRRWQRYTIDEPPRETGVTHAGTKMFAPSGAAVWNTPTVDAKRKLIYVGTGNSFGRLAADTSDSILALRMADGKLMWHHQEFAGDSFMNGCKATNAADTNCPEKLGPDYDFGGSSAILQTVNGKDVLVAAGKGGVAIGLDPDAEGKLLWRTQLWETTAPSASGLVVWGGTADGQRVYYPLQQPGGGLKALQLTTGKVDWNAPVNADRRGQAGPATSISGVVFTGGWDGILRAVDASGKIIWTYDANHDYQTVNGVIANGGSFGCAGVVVSGGMVYVSSGYAGIMGGSQGNVVLAFAAE